MVVEGLLVEMVMVMMIVMMMVMIRVKAGGERIVELDCEGGDFDWLVGWLVDEGGGRYLSFWCFVYDGTDGREDGMGYGISVVTSVIDLEGMIDA